jgi:ribosomal-protein-alanine N-acetyltransferase
VFRASDDALTGGITLSNMRRGVAQMGSVGYWCGRPFTRQGHTLGAVRALTGFAFRSLGLHRLEAACVPENAPSRALLLKAGFVEEGFAKAYLKINGAWRDHVLFGQVTPFSAPEGPDEGVSV